MASLCCASWSCFCLRFGVGEGEKERDREGERQREREGEIGTGDTLGADVLFGERASQRNSGTDSMERAARLQAPLCCNEKGWVLSQHRCHPHPHLNAKQSPQAHEACMQTAERSA